MNRGPVRTEDYVMSVFKPMQKIFLLGATAVAVVSCGGGGSSGGIDRLGATSGTVTGFGSVYVNGTRYKTDSAAFDIDDKGIDSSQQDLAVGDVVTVFYSTAAPTVALEVISDEAVEGPIDSIGPDPDTLVVAGQTVLITAETSFDDFDSLADLAVGDFLEVSGYVTGVGGVSASAVADTAISATRIEKKVGCATPGDCKIEVHGQISDLDTPDVGYFMINDLLVDHRSALLDDLPGDALAEGLQVEVKGTVYDATTQTLTANKIEGDGYEDEVGDVDEFEIEGLINRFVSAEDFYVDDVRVTTTGDTEYEPEGMSADDLGQGVKVEVEGEFDDLDVLVVKKVEFEEHDADDLRVRAQVQAVNTDDKTLKLLGIWVRVDERTRVEDKTGEDRDRSESFGLGDINVDDYVEVRGGPDPLGIGDMLAARLERLERPDVDGEGVKLRGYVEDEVITPPFLTIEGVTVDTTGASFYDEVADESIDATTFFGRIAVGDLIGVSGTQTGDASMDADEVEIED
jgi:hypothetical protein